MKSKLLLCLTLILSGGLFTCTSSLASQTFTSSHYGFQLDVPDGWTARDTYFLFEHYSDVFLTINNQRPNLEIGDWETGTNTTLDQMRPGEVYVSVGYSSGPMGDSMRSDTVGDDLMSLLATKRISPSGQQPGLSELNLGFVKRGHSWFVSVSMKAPVTEENCNRVMAMLKSFRFLDAPVANSAWAESLAWRELPQNIQTPELWPGWRTVDRDGAGPQTATYGGRAVTVQRTAAEYKVKFTLMGIGTWEYSVQTNGTVQAEPLVFDAINVPASRWPSDLPGEVKGKVDAYWVAPYVQAISQLGKKTLIWFSKDGSIERQASIDNDPELGFAGISGRPNIIQGINEDWQITLPYQSNSLLAGGAISTDDSRVFVHERHPEFGLIALDIYIHGKRVNTVGPYPQYRGTDAVLNEDGSAALLVTETNRARATPLRGDALRDAFAAADQVHAQVVTLNTNGRVQFKTDCGPLVWSPIVAPNGVGVLLRPNTDGSAANRFMWFTAAGRQYYLEISPNPQFLGWIPGTCQSLFSAGMAGQSGPYRLIDWNSGKMLWTIPSPGKGEVMGIGFTPEFIFFSVAESYPSGEWNNVNESLLDSGEKWLQRFYAVNVRDGMVAARWRGQFPHRWYNANRDYFLRLGTQLYYITADEFTEINTEDVREKRNGWE